MDGGATGILNLFTDKFMGHGGPDSAPLGPPWQKKTAPFRADGFYVPGATPHRDDGDNPFDPPREVRRSVAGEPASNADDQDVLDAPDFPTMRVRLENVHNAMHGFVRMGSQHVSFRDPFVFLLHSNCDRLFARWQTDAAHPERLDPDAVYGAESDVDVAVDTPCGPSVQNLTHLVEPWSTGVGVCLTSRPWESEHERQGVRHDYHDIWVVTPPIYDGFVPDDSIPDYKGTWDSEDRRLRLVINQIKKVVEVEVFRKPNNFAFKFELQSRTATEIVSRQIRFETEESLNPAGTQRFRHRRVLTLLNEDTLRFVDDIHRTFPPFILGDPPPDARAELNLRRSS